MTRTTHEQIQVHRRADHRDPERGRGGREAWGTRPQARDHRDDLLPLEGEVRRDGGLRSEAAQESRGGKPAPQADGRRAGARSVGTEGGPPKKMVKPAAFRLAVGFVEET